MPLAAIALVLLSAILHVTWNAVVKTSAAPLRIMARGLALTVLVATPFVALTWLEAGRVGLSGTGWALAGISGALETVFWILLAFAYRRGEFSIVYPVARGSAALLSAVIGLGILGEQLGPVAMIGVAALIAGTTLAILPRLRHGGVAAALALGVVVAGYSTVDRLGVREGPPWLYAWAVFGSGAVLLLLITGGWGWWRGKVAPPRPGQTSPVGVPSALGALGAGLLMVTAYSLVLAALAIAPLAAVAPLRESSTVLAAAWGVVGLNEREGMATRLLAAAAIAAGAVLLSLGR